MGCSSGSLNSKNNSEADRSNKQSLISEVTLRSGMRSPRNSRVDRIDKERTKMQLTYEYLENYDLLMKFLKKTKIKDYFSYILKTKNLAVDNNTRFKGLYSEIKDLILELFKRYQIDYQIPLVDTVVDVDIYKLECTPSTDEDLDLYMPLFFFEFCLYPKSYILNSKIKSVIFVNSITFSEEGYSQYRAACPEYNKTFSLYYSTKERSINYIRQVIHHEYFHYVDWVDDGTYEDKDWRGLNMSNFSYGNGGKNERDFKQLDDKCKGFLNFYSTTGIEEDKAEVFQYLLSGPFDAMSNEDEIIRRKLSHMMSFLRKFDPEGMGREDYDYFEALNDLRTRYYY